MLTDPHPNPTRWVGRRVSFDHAGKRLVGTVEKQEYIGLTERGKIPDYKLTIRGGSGATLEISLVEAYCTF